MKKLILVVIMAIGICAARAGSSTAGKETGGPAKVQKSAKNQSLVERVVNGIITKKEKKNKKGKAVISYVLIDTEGKKIKLLTPKTSKKNDTESVPVINLEDYLNVYVKVVGKGKETEKKGKKRIRVMTVASIEEMDEKEVGELAEVQKTKVKKRAEKASLQELIVKGRITKKERKTKKGKTVISYVLTDTEGNEIKLQKPKASKKKAAESEAAINLDDHLNVDVKVVGKGTETEKKGKKKIKIQTIKSIEKTAE